MKILLIAAATVVAVIAISAAFVLFIGSRLPKDHTVSRSIRINRPVSDVYRTIRYLENHPNWRDGVASIELLPPESASGRPRFRETGPHGTVTYEISEDIPNRRLVTTILDRDLGYSGSWTYAFESDGEAATNLTITENGEVTNLLFRFLSYYVFGHTATIDTYLKALSNQLGGT
ncbi:MAG TPA: SRPBCC family protein [Pyrinomonadaceae bacterium]|nr:SRPBCC family protein [Pyrinomonadaceae bacterium]